jgi:hypothetical protein
MRTATCASCILTLMRIQIRLITFSTDLGPDPYRGSSVRIFAHTVSQNVMDLDTGLGKYLEQNWTAKEKDIVLFRTAPCKVQTA